MHARKLYWISALVAPMIVIGLWALHVPGNAATPAAAAPANGIAQAQQEAQALDVQRAQPAAGGAGAWSASISASTVKKGAANQHHRARTVYGETDPNGTTPELYIVQLQGAPVATYDGGLPNLLIARELAAQTMSAQDGWRRAVEGAIARGIPVPCHAAALSYFDAYRSPRLPQNLTQAQRDAFGAHTYERIDRPGSLHSSWTT